MIKPKLIADLFMILFPIIISAMGGAMMVYSVYDDSPKGLLLGLGLVITALYLALKNTMRSIR